MILRKLSRGENIVVMNMRDTYSELGTYEFKVVLDPKIFKGGCAADIEVRDSDGEPISSLVRPWGTKLMCKFTIDDGCSDGVATVKVHALDSSERWVDEYLQFWVIK